MRKGIWGFALVAIMLLMASCSSKSEYANAIPKDRPPEFPFPPLQSPPVAE